MNRSTALRRAEYSIEVQTTVYAATWRRRPRGDDTTSALHTPALSRRDVTHRRTGSIRVRHLYGRTRCATSTRGKKYGFSSGPLPGVQTSREQHHTVCGYYRRHFETPLGLHSMFDYASGMLVHHKPLPVDVHPLPVEMVRRVVLKWVLPRCDRCECYVRLLSLAVQQALDAFSEARVSKVVT